MIKEIKQDILNSDANMIVQQVNCKGVMGAGLAKVIRTRYPEVYTVYRNAYSAGYLFLGNVIYVRTNDYVIANACGQNDLGWNKRYTDYNALEICFKNILAYANKYCIPKIAIPHMIGCGLAGGDWGIVREMIYDIFDETNVNVDICKI